MGRVPRHQPTSLRHVGGLCVLDGDVGDHVKAGELTVAELPLLVTGYLMVRWTVIDKKFPVRP